MFPIKFNGQNGIHRASGCIDLPTRIEYNETFQANQISSCWELDDEDIMSVLKAIEAGRRPCIMLSVIGGQPPVWLGVR